MSHRYIRTQAGQTEIQSRALNLARPVRNLLLILSPDKPADFWLSQVKGCGPDDLNHLQHEGLIAPYEPAAVPVPGVRPAAPGGAPETDPEALRQRIQELPYAPLYEALNLHGKDTLGLVGGYRFALEIERCSGAPELQALALRYLAQLREKHGQDVLRRFAALLNAPERGAAAASAGRR